MCVTGTTHTVREATKVSRRKFLTAGLAAGIGAAASGVLPAAPALAAHRRHVQDLTHVFTTEFPTYGGLQPTRETLVTVEEDGFYLQRWTFAEHSGTHLDAPGHFVAGNRLADELTAGELLVPIVVVDIRRRAAADPDATVEVRDLMQFERRHGRIPRRALVAMNSGWAAFAGDLAAYRGDDPDGVFHFPGFGSAAVEWLLERRDISGIGVDTLSLDHGPSTSFTVHVTALGADKYGVENLANLDHIPPSGAHAFVGLVPWQEGSGGPCRVIASWG